MPPWWLVPGGGDVYSVGTKKPSVLFAGGVPLLSSPSSCFLRMSTLLEITMLIP